MTALTEGAFEFQLCAHVERVRMAVVARQIGASPLRDRRRIIDIVAVAPGPAFEARSQIGPATIPEELIRAEIPSGRAVPVGQCLSIGPPYRETVLEAGVAAGYIECERRAGRTYVRRTVAYPSDWFGPILAIENKPDLNRPGALTEQLRFDLSLAVADRVVIATASSVTGAHLNRIPAAVGVWEFDPAAGALTVHREPAALPVDSPAMVPTEQQSDHTELRAVSVGQKQRLRRQIAERAYGRGWRRFPLVGCTHFHLDEAAAPHCRELDRPIDPTHTCGTHCPYFTGASPPTDIRVQKRAERTPWEPEVDGFAREQSRIGEF